MNKEQIIGDLIDIGLKENDVVYVSSNLLRVGYFENNREAFYNNWVEIFLKVIGNGGTIVCPAYSNFFIKLKKNKKIIFNYDSSTTSGSLSKALLKYKNSKRSSHPTNSLVAIGKNANKIIEKHNENSLSYTPFKKIIDLNGKGLLIGNIGKNGFFPYHLVQEELGITKKHLFAGFFQSYYYDKNYQIKLFTRVDYGGCDISNYNFIQDLIKINALKIGRIGNAEAIIYDGKKIYNFFHDIFKSKSEKIKCSDKNCLTCQFLFEKKKLLLLKILLFNFSRYFKSSIKLLS